jgi:hypothetical protein
MLFEHRFSRYNRGCAGGDFKVGKMLSGWFRQMRQNGALKEIRSTGIWRTESSSSISCQHEGPLIILQETNLKEFRFDL